MAVDVEPAAPPTGDQDPLRRRTPDGPVARRGWSPKRIALVLGAFLALGAVLLFTGGSGDEVPGEQAAQDPAAPVPSLTGELQDGFVVFTDPQTGISLQHPKAWVPLQRPNGTLRLSVGTGNGTGLRVRVDPTEGVVDTAEELEAVRALTDKFASAEGVQVVQREAVEINGMIGISYLARFTHEETGAKVANAHYFLFKGNTMHNLLFQAVPEEDFERLAPEFNNILASFQGVPVEGPPTEAPPAE
jgi:hypothetical protein